MGHAHEKSAKMMVETKKNTIPNQGHSDLRARPLLVGHAPNRSTSNSRHLDENEARDIPARTPGICESISGEDGGYVTPVECAGDSRPYQPVLRQDSTIDNGLKPVVR